MITKKLFPVFIFLFVSVLFFSCEKEEVLADLNFQVEEVNGTYQCSWTATNISTFKNYYIVHSPFLVEEVDSQNNSSNRWSKLDLQSINSKEIIIESEEDLTLYFQLFVEIEDRIIRSNVVVFEKNNSEVIDLNLCASIIAKDWNSIYLFEYNRNFFSHYNFIEKEVKETVSLNFDLNQYFTCVGNNGLGDELYLINGTQLNIFDAATLIKKTSFVASGYIRGVTTNNNGLIVLTVQDESSPIQIIDRSSLTVLNSLTSSNYIFGSQKVEFLSKENNELVEAGETNFKYFKIDDNGATLEEADIEPPFPNNERFFHNMTSSPFENYFAVNFDGHVFDRSLNALADLSTLFGDDYLHYFFGRDETVLYASVYDPDLGDKCFVDKFSIPSFQHIERKEYGGDILNLFYRNEKIHGIFFSNYWKCIFIKTID